MNILNSLIKKNLRDCALRREVEFVCVYLMTKNVDLTRLNIWYDSIKQEAECCEAKTGYFAARSSFCIFLIVKELVKIGVDFSKFLDSQVLNLKVVGKYGCNRPDSFRYHDYRDELQSALGGLFIKEDAEFWMKALGFKV